MRCCTSAGPSLASSRGGSAVSLRNVERTAPYFHDGSVETLEEAVQIMVELQLGLDLTDREVDELGAFLRALTGEVPAAALQTAG